MAEAATCPFSPAAARARSAVPAWSAALLVAGGAPVVRTNSASGRGTVRSRSDFQTAIGTVAMPMLPCLQVVIPMPNPTLQVSLVTKLGAAAICYSLGERRAF